MSWVPREETDTTSAGQLRPRRVAISEITTGILRIRRTWSDYTRPNTLRSRCEDETDDLAMTDDRFEAEESDTISQSTETAALLGVRYKSQQAFDESVWPEVTMRKTERAAAMP